MLQTVVWSWGSNQQVDPETLIGTGKIESGCGSFEFWQMVRIPGKDQQQPVIPLFGQPEFPRRKGCLGAFEVVIVPAVHKLLPKIGFFSTGRGIEKDNTA